ncbi:phosphopantetheine-binding protein [Streptomyces sp. NPDC041068]|uniref:phosphopantetheine-binding protein n=1 Tax=Streptomyces sp. NPDC041068 TaxID=3155130 RepID=UPI0033F3D47C
MTDAQPDARIDTPVSPRTDTQVSDAVTEVLMRILSVSEEDVTPESRLADDLDADSLDLSEITAALAARGFVVDKADVKARASTVADLIALVDSPSEPA